MYNPQHIEKRLAPIDLKTQRRTRVVTVVLTLVILGLIIAVLEAIYQIVTYLNK